MFACVCVCVCVRVCVCVCVCAPLFTYTRRPNSPVGEVVAVVGDEVVRAITLAIVVEELSRHVRRACAVARRRALPRDVAVTCHRLPTHVVPVVPAVESTSWVTQADAGATLWPEVLPVFRSLALSPSDSLPHSLTQ